MDVYAFGIFIWELASREIPYDDSRCEKQSLTMIVNSIVNDDLRPKMTEKVKNELPPPMMELMKTCWSGDIAARPDMGAVISQLEGIAAERALPSESASGH